MILLSKCWFRQHTWQTESPCRQETWQQQCSVTNYEQVSQSHSHGIRHHQHCQFIFTECILFNNHCLLSGRMAVGLDKIIPVCVLGKLGASPKKTAKRQLKVSKSTRDIWDETIMSLTVWRQLRIVAAGQEWSPLCRQRQSCSGLVSLLAPSSLLP